MVTLVRSRALHCLVSILIAAGYTFSDETSPRDTTSTRNITIYSFGMVEEDSTYQFGWGRFGVKGDLSETVHANIQLNITGEQTLKYGLIRQTYGPLQLIAGQLLGDCYDAYVDAFEIETVYPYSSDGFTACALGYQLKFADRVGRHGGQMQVSRFNRQRTSVRAGWILREEDGRSIETLNVFWEEFVGCGITSYMPTFQRMGGSAGATWYTHGLYESAYFLQCCVDITKKIRLRAQYDERRGDEDDARLIVGGVLEYFENCTLWLDYNTHSENVELRIAYNITFLEMDL